MTTVGIRVPRSLLRSTAVIQDYLGEGARGPRYSDARTVRCSIQPTSRLMTHEDGATVAVDTLMIIRPEDGPVPIESRVTAESVEYRAVRTFAYPDGRRPTHFEVALLRYAVGSGAPGSGS